MKKLLLIGLICLTGCSNPVSSKMEKEGDKTRAEFAAELATAKIEISAELQAKIDQLRHETGADIDSIISYLQYIVMQGRIR